MSPYPENESAYKIGWEHLATSSIDLAAAEGKSEIPVIVRIGRLGRLFQLMMLIIRQRANPLDAQEVLVEDGQIIIKKIPNGDGKFTPFLPKCDDKGALQMASLKDSGFEAMVYLYHIAGRVMITPRMFLPRRMTLHPLNLLTALSTMSRARF